MHSRCLSVQTQRLQLLAMGVQAECMETQTGAVRAEDHLDLPHFYGIGPLMLPPQRACLPC